MRSHSYLGKFIKSEHLKSFGDIKGINNKDVIDLIVKIEASNLYFIQYLPKDVSGDLKDPQTWQTLGFDASKSIIDKANSLASIKLWKEAGNRDAFFNINKNNLKSAVAITPRKYKSEREDHSLPIEFAKPLVVTLNVSSLKESDFASVAMNIQPMSEENVAKLGLTIFKDIIAKINKYVDFTVSKAANSNILDFVIIDESTKASPPYLAISVAVNMFEAPEESKIDDDYHQIIKAGVTLLLSIFSTSNDVNNFLNSTFPESLVTQDFISQFGFEDYRAQIAGALAIGELKAKKDQGRNIVFTLTRNGKEMQFTTTISVFFSY